MTKFSRARLILTVDSSAALFVGLGILLLPIPFESWYSLPRSLFLFTGFVNLGYGFYSGSLVIILLYENIFQEFSFICSLRLILLGLWFVLELFLQTGLPSAYQEQPTFCSKEFLYSYQLFWNIILCGQFVIWGKVYRDVNVILLRHFSFSCNWLGVFFSRNFFLR